MEVGDFTAAERRAFRFVQCAPKPPLGGAGVVDGLDCGRLNLFVGGELPGDMSEPEVVVRINRATGLISSSDVRDRLADPHSGAAEPATSTRPPDGLTGRRAAPGLRVSTMTPFASQTVSLEDRAAGEIADPRRLRRERARWDGLDQATRLARIVVLDHGGRRRPVIHRGSRHLRSRIVSAKTRLLQISEGKGLRFLILRCEVDGDVVDYQAHPFRIDAVVGGEILTWYPDLVWVRRGGRPHLVEVKTRIDDLDDPDYLAKLEAMAEVARLIGWTMQVLYDEDVFGAKGVAPVRRRNVAAIHARRFLRVAAAEQRALSGIVTAGAPVSWAAARDALAPDDALRGDAVVEWAIARGRLAADLDRAITPRTVLHPLSPAAPTATIRI